MKFFVEIDGKQRLVQVARPPKNADSLQCFKRMNGSTFVGTPDLFSGLKPGGKAGAYIAAGIKSHITIVSVEQTINIVSIVENEEEDDCVEEPVIPVKPIVPPPQEEDINYNSFNFSFDDNRVKKGDRNGAWVTYVNDKRTWVIRYGSEHLKLALDMGCKCDNKYVIERARKEFCLFDVYEEYAHSEIDTPDIATLRFLKNNAFVEQQRKVLQTFNSRLVLGWPYEDDEKIPGSEKLIIQGFLGMCDLVCSLSEYICYVEKWPDSGM